MCILTFLNIKNEDVQKELLLILEPINAQRGHKDGTGFYSGGKLFKTKISADNLINYYVFVQDIKNNPVIAHVRQASVGNKLLDDSKAHPFESVEFVLAHNGTLNLKSALEKDKYPGKIDSEIFLFKLTDLRIANPDLDFVNLFNITMDLFEGKFAFLIYDKRNKKYYVIRGDTAKLFYSKIKVNGIDSGFVVNTDREALQTALVIIKNFSLYKYNILIETSIIEELKSEKIYLVENEDLVEKGACKENKAFFQVAASAGSTAIVTVPQNYGTPNISDNKDVETSTAKKLNNFLLDSGLSLEDLDKILFFCYGHGLLYVTDKEVEDFLGIKDVFLDPLKNNANVKTLYLTSLWGADDIFIEHRLQFPYMFNKYKNLTKVVKKMERTNK